MPRTCTICGHPSRKEIDGQIIESVAFRRIAAQFGVSETSLRRHAESHLPSLLVRARDAEQVADAGSLLDRLQALERRAMGLLSKAEGSGDLRTALAGIREARACLETLAEVSGELDRRPTVNISMSPEWHEVRAVLLDALASYPEARLAVAARLSQLDMGQ